MIQSTKSPRFNYIDYFRGLVISFVVLQHAVQGYALQWGGRLWFLDLPERDHWFDMVFMWTDGFIMQALFFVSGLFVLPSLYRRGWFSFTLEKFIRLGIPLVFGILVLVPPLSYVKYEQTQEPGIGYFDYWFNVFLEPQSFRVGGFWFLGMLLLFTFVAGTLDKILPFIKELLASFVRWLCTNPKMGYLIVGSLVAILISVSDLLWGTYWWIGLDNLFDLPQNSAWHYLLSPFVARGNMLYSYVLFFLLGIGFFHSGILKDSDFLKKASDSWFSWLFLLMILTAAYSWYNQTYWLDGAFSNELTTHFYYGGSLADAWPLLKDVAPGILARTILHGFMCTAQIITLIILLYRFTNDSQKAWTSLGVCSYGIYIFHEPCIVYTQYFLMNFELSNILKVLIAFAIGLSVSWIIAHVLRQLPITRRIL